MDSSFFSKGKESDLSSPLYGHGQPPLMSQAIARCPTWDDPSPFSQKGFATNWRLYNPMGCSRDRTDILAVFEIIVLVPRSQLLG